MIGRIYAATGDELPSCLSIRVWATIKRDARADSQKFGRLPA